MRPLIMLAVVAVLLTLSTTLALPLIGQQSMALARPAAPFVSLFGPESAITAREYVRVTGAEAWRDLWKRHVGSEAAARGQVHWTVPQVNFDECMVVGIFSGEAWNCDGHYVVSIDETDDAVTLRFDSHTYQTSGPNGGGVRATPFGLFIIPRTAKELIIEENVQGLIGRPPKWKVQHRFDSM